MRLSFGIVLFWMALQVPTAEAMADAAESRTLLSARPANIASVLGDIGYTVTASKANDGSDMLEDSERRFVIHFGQCNKQSCKVVQVRMCFDAPNASAELANIWNTREMFGRVSMASAGLMCVDDALFSSDGLVSIAQLRSQIEALIAIKPAVENLGAEG